MNRYALVDKRGKNRGTCEAEVGSEASKEFRRRRGEKLLPQGWKVVCRGKVVAPKQKSIGELSMKLTVKDLPEVNELLDRALRCMQEQRETIDAQAETIGQLAADRAKAFMDLDSSIAARLRLQAAMDSLEESAKFYASKLDDINSLVRTWSILGATSIPTILYGLKRVLDRKQEG